MNQTTLTLQIITLILLITGILFLNHQGKTRENQILIWLDDAEKEREEIAKRVLSLEVDKRRTDPEYTQFD